MKRIKENKKLIVGIIIGCIITGTIGVYAAGIYVLSADQVGFTSGSGLTSDNVQDAIDEIYRIRNEKLCKRATTLHTETCTNTDTAGFCRKDGYLENETITYGRLGTGNTLTQGDAFDCDINRDGTYNATNERFYYVTDLNSTTVVLIYYNNTTKGVPDNTSASFIAYDESNENWHGPTKAVENLPHSGQWKTRVYSNPRQITTNTGTTSTSGGELPTFIYPDARLLTYQEVAANCPNPSTVGSLKECNYLLENTKYSSSRMSAYGYWLETPNSSSSSDSIRMIYSGNRNISGVNANGAINYGVRPAIEVPKIDIEY